MTTTQHVQYTQAGRGRYRVTVDGVTVGTVSRWLRGTPSWRWESYLPDGVTVNKRSPLSYPTREKATELLLTFGNPPPPRTEPDVVPGFDLIDACDARPGDVIRVPSRVSWADPDCQWNSEVTVTRVEVFDNGVEFLRYIDAQGKHDVWLILPTWDARKIARRAVEQVAADQLTDTHLGARVTFLTPFDGNPTVLAWDGQLDRVKHHPERNRLCERGTVDLTLRASGVPVEVSVRADSAVMVGPHAC